MLNNIYNFELNYASYGLHKLSCHFKGDGFVFEVTVPRHGKVISSKFGKSFSIGESNIDSYVDVRIFFPYDCCDYSITDKKDKVVLTLKFYNVSFDVFKNSRRNQYDFHFRLKERHPYVIEEDEEDDECED